MKAKSLMILGTASGVGKSVITAGLCRLFSDWGYKVAPFKAQNMSNNSYVTENGGEMGRAQVVQAECARTIPHTDMNPILLKPEADNLSQVVLHGKAIGRFSAREYYGNKIQWLRAVQESYERLASENQILVIEGAGSPAEVNLKRHDIVNMQTAKLADATCLLVGDIDRGGVFASLLGTLELLDADEQSMIAGFIVNKFRGDISLFDDGRSFLEEKSGRKVFGVIPYRHNLWLDEEDALNVEQMKASAPNSKFLDIAVILLPRMSNFTDFEILAREPNVRLRYVKRAIEVGFPDLLIIPGTKSTIADLNYLNQNGFREKIMEYTRLGGNILGVCGGYQMLGKRIIDSEGIESAQAEAEGFGLFNMTTEFLPEKKLRRSTEALNLPLFGGISAGKVSVYEIHMGKTIHHEEYVPFGEDGAVHSSGRCAGTYYHGLFEEAEFRNSFLTALAEDRSKQNVNSRRLLLSGQELKEINYNDWARHLTKYLDINWLREWAPELNSLHV